MTPPVRICALLATVGAALVVAGCMTRPPAPVDERGPPISSPPPTPPPPAAVVREPEAPPRLYTVKRGETLAQIALENGLDYRELAVWNNIENPNVIRVGQVLVLSPPGQAGTGPGGCGHRTLWLPRPPLLQATSLAR